MRNPARFVLALSVVLMASACAPATTNTSAPSGGTTAGTTSGPTAGPTRAADVTITVNRPGEPAALEPGNVGVELNQVAQLFSPLFFWRIGPDGPTPAPAAALSVTLTSDPLVWDVKMRSGMKAHNGEVVDAEDAAWTINHWLNPATKAPNMAFQIANSKIKSAVAVDPLTLRITTLTPNGVLPRFLTRWQVLPKDYYSALPAADWATKPMGSGPYKLTEYVKGDHITMERFDGYWGDKSAVKTVIWRTVPEQSTRIANLNTGAADLISNLAPDQFGQIDAKVATPKSNNNGARRIFIGVNFKANPALQKKEVRQALNYAVDIQKILDRLVPGAKRTASFIASCTCGDPALKPYSYDKQKALDLLRQAGYTDKNGDGLVDNPDGSPLALKMQYVGTLLLAESDLAQAIAAEWKATGINVQAVTVSATAMSSQMLGRTVQSDLFLSSSGFAYAPQAELSTFYSKGSNPVNWANAGYDEAWEKLGITFDEKERQALTYKMDGIFRDESPAIAVYNQPDIYGVSNKLDWAPDVTDLIYFDQVKLK